MTTNYTAKETRASDNGNNENNCAVLQPTDRNGRVSARTTDNAPTPMVLWSMVNGKRACDGGAGKKSKKLTNAKRGRVCTGSMRTATATAST